VQNKSRTLIGGKLSDNPVASDAELFQEITDLVDTGYNDLYDAMTEKFSRSHFCISALSFLKRAEFLLPQSINTNNTNNINAIADLYAFTALAYALHGNYDKALDYVNKTREICDDDIPVLVAELLVFLNAYDEAESDNPKLTDCFNFEGSIYDDNELNEIKLYDFILKLAQNVCEVFEMEYLDLLTDPKESGLLDSNQYFSMIFDAFIIHYAISGMEDDWDIIDLCWNLIRAPWDLFDIDDFDEDDHLNYQKHTCLLIAEIFLTLANN
jgi:hypothetical protein